MRVIITGGSGLIGSALTADLAGDGYEVVVLSRNPERARGLPSGARAERWDARSAAGWGSLVDGETAIVNLAGENLSSGPWTASRRERIRRSRFEAGRAVAEAVAQAAHKPRVVVQASGVNFYGDRGDETTAEDAPQGDDFLASVCGEWEASSAEVERHGVRRAVIRTGLVLSHWGGVLPLWALPFRLGIGGRLGDGRQWVSWIHIADEVSAIRFLIENESARGVFNLCAPEPATNRQFSRAIAHVLRRPNMLFAPGFAMRAVLGEMSVLVLKGQRAIPLHLKSLGFQFYYPQLEPALRNLLR